MTVERLSALDATFLAVERPATPMHVGWVAVFDPPEQGRRPRARELVGHVAARLDHAPRYRQRLASVPFGLHEPVWVDDPRFDAATHVHAAGRHEGLDALVARVLSNPLPRDRPLWELWIADNLPERRIAIVGKAHHCMVDGVAAMQLTNLLLEREPDEWTRRPSGRGRAAADADRNGWPPAPEPSFVARLGRAAVDRAAEGATVALAPARFVASPLRVLGLPVASARAARTVAHTVLPPAPESPFNRAGSSERRLVRLTRSLDDVRAVRRRFGVTPNDVVLAAVAGALRRFAERRHEPVRRLKAMVPADVRSNADSAGSGNRISFLFLELPCDEPDPVGRLMLVHAATAQRERDGEAEAVDAGLRALALAPRTLQRALAQAVSHPRFFNLVVSSIPGPAVARYLRGCRLREIHPAVPLADRHAVSIGVVTVAGQACFGLYADAVALPDADALADDLGAAMDELVAVAAQSTS